jgi:hypothetical protein
VPDATIGLTEEDVVGVAADCACGVTELEKMMKDIDNGCAEYAETR